MVTGTGFENNSPIPQPGHRSLLPGAIQSDGSDFHWDTFPAVAARTTGQPAYGVVLGAPLRGQDGMTWLRVAAIPVFAKGESGPYPVCTVIETIEAQAVSKSAGAGL